MKNAASGWNNRNLINNIVQVNFIALFFVLFFALARVSELYGTAWSDSFTGLVIAGIVLLQIKGGFIKPDYRDVTVCALLITIHYLIRAGLVGTVQLDEGLTCYESLEKLLYNPDIIVTDFLEAGKIADRNAHGYCFFALMGEFLIPGRGTGFQWSQFFMGMAAAACIYMTFRRLFPKARLIILFFAALVVSLSPMALGMSTLCGLEYGMTMFFIYALYCCVNKKY